jgi:hypothetical protein
MPALPPIPPSRRYWVQGSLFDALTLREIEVSGRMWTIKPSDEQRNRMAEQIDAIGHAIQRLRDYPAETAELGPVGLSRLLGDLSTLLLMNTRLMVCYAVEAGIMSEGQGARHLGLDRVTFREIKEAARVWAERAGKGPDDQSPPLSGRAAGGRPGEPAEAGVAGPG